MIFIMWKFRRVIRRALKRVFYWASLGLGATLILWFCVWLLAVAFDW